MLLRIHRVGLWGWVVSWKEEGGKGGKEGQRRTSNLSLTTLKRPVKLPIPGHDELAAHNIELVLAHERGVPCAVGVGADAETHLLPRDE